MSSNMTLAMSGLRERLLAVLTLVGPLTRVCSHVTLEIEGEEESLPTQSALVRLLPGVDLHVTQQGTSVIECFRADVTREGGLVTVAPSMALYTVQ